MTTLNFQVTPHFKLTEPGLACKCCQRVRLITEFFECMKLLEEMRVTLGYPIDIVSGYRCPEHNKAVGGAKDSMHMQFAADIRPLFVSGEAPEIWEAKLHTMYDMASRMGFNGLGRYDSWIHVDTRHGFMARWDERKHKIT